MEIPDEHYKKVLDNLYDGIFFINKDRNIIYWNKGAEEHTGYRPEEVTGKNCWDNILMHVDERGEKLSDASCPIFRSVADGCLREVNVYFRHKEGHMIPISMRIAPMKDANDQIVVAVEIINESSPKYLMQQKMEELKNLTLLDPLTELGNRRHIDMVLRGRAEELRRYEREFGVLFIDIDYFKSINDTYGHDVGDRVLKMVSRTVLNSLRSFDFVGRWGGEEFVAVLVNVDEEQLYLVAERLRLLVEQSSLSIDSQMVRATVSIGAALAQKGESIESLIKRADQLMYSSKFNGRNCVSA
jgi:diguanylate cyclase (GGDEF)-like protein/PAS domain S-box-containing protein